MSSLAKYISDFGWEPIVLTIPLPGNPGLGYRVIEVPYYDILNSLLRRFVIKTDNELSYENVMKSVNQKLGVIPEGSLKNFVFLRLRDLVTYPSPARDWESPAIRAGMNLLQREDIKAIISTSPPVVSHLVANKLKSRCKIPWVADFPHLWSQNNGYPYGSLRKMFDKRLEVKTISQADVLMTINEPMVETLGIIHKKQPIHAVVHGFDPETLNHAPDNLTEKFTITYTGSFAPSLREPTKLFVAIQRLLSQGIIERDSIEVRFYGPKESWIDRDIEMYGLSGVVKQYGKVPLQIAHKRQRESQLLLVPKWQDPRDNSIISMKIFEYLAARRPILAIGGHRDVVDDLLEETHAGVCAMSDTDIEYVLKELYWEYREKGKLAFSGDTVKIDKYSQREMARTFAAVLNHLTQ